MSEQNPFKEALKILVEARKTVRESLGIPPILPRIREIGFKQPPTIIRERQERAKESQQIKPQEVKPVVLEAGTLFPIRMGIYKVLEATAKAIESKAKKEEAEAEKERREVEEKTCFLRK